MLLLLLLLLLLSLLLFCHINVLCCKRLPSCIIPTLLSMLLQGFCGCWVFFFFLFLFLQHIYSSTFPTNIIYMIVCWHCTCGTIVMWSDYERTLNEIVSSHFSVVKVWWCIFRKNILIILSFKTVFLVNTFKGTNNIAILLVELNIKRKVDKFLETWLVMT